MISSNYYLHCSIISKHRATVRQSIRRLYAPSKRQRMDGIVCHSTAHNSRSSFNTHNRPQIKFPTFSVSLPNPLKPEINSACTWTPSSMRIHNEPAPIHTIRSHLFNSIAHSHMCIQSPAKQPNNSIRRNNGLPAWLRMRIDLFVVTMIWSWLWYCVRNTLVDQIKFDVESGAATVLAVYVLFTRSTTISKTTHSFNLFDRINSCLN